MTDDEFKQALVALAGTFRDDYEERCYKLSLEYAMLLDSVRARATYLNAMMQACRDMDDVRGYRAVEDVRKLFLN